MLEEQRAECRQILFLKFFSTNINFFATILTWEEQRLKTD
jgi:hypothetical protein